ncbi:MAG: FAD-binding oxidoreductase [Myxococcales bacterium]|nr:FAD-binding oxidoreductase [Myxococcales bacterium]
MPVNLRDRLADFPADFATDDPSTLAEYGRDWTKVHTPSPSLLVRPRTTDEVSRFLRLASAENVAVVPSGGRTGLAGGAVAARGEVVLSLERMRRMDPVDTLGATVRVQAGAITEQVHQHCAPLGLTWPVDFASKGSSQVGGNIATNAGGVKVIRYGLTRNWVLGLEVVLADGTVLELNGALEKNNTGADLRQLFIGSEGTLGVITEATLKLTRLPARLDVMLFAVADLSAAVALFRAARKGPFTLSAFEVFSDRCLARLLSHRKLRDPFAERHGYYVLVEAEAAEDLEGFTTKLFEDGLAADGVLAQHGGQAAELWGLREGISESLSATGLPHKNDVALPVAALEAFTQDLEALVAAEYPGFEVNIFGHMGDGNLHVNVMKPESMDRAAFLATTKRLDPQMFELVKRHHGSISAEHGIGLLKRDYLSYSRSPAEIALLRGLKATLDPRGILNPGKILGDSVPQSR